MEGNLLRFRVASNAQDPGSGQIELYRAPESHCQSMTYPSGMTELNPTIDSYSYFTGV